MAMFRRVETVIGTVALCGAVLGLVLGAGRIVAAGSLGMLAAALLLLFSISERMEGRGGMLGRISALESVNADAEDFGGKVAADLDYLKNISSRLDLLGGEMSDVKAAQELLRRDLISSTWRQTNEISSMFQLYRLVSPKEAMPAFLQWSVAVQELVLLFSLLDQRKPENVIELGSGNSTVWLSYGLSRLPKSKITSIEHLPEQHERTAEAIDRHGIASIAEARLADLVSLDLGGETFRWYEPTKFDDVGQIDLLFVNGPPGGVRPMAKYPAMPVLGSRLAPDATVILREADGAVRDTIASRWCAETVGLEQVPSACENMAVLGYRPSGGS